VGPVSRRHAQPEPEDAEPTFLPSDVYRLALMGVDGFTAAMGKPPSPELIQAEADRRARQAANSAKPWTRVHIPRAGDDVA
jgi:hypothetical protein